MNDGLLRQAANSVDLGGMEATGTTMFVVLIVQHVTERTACAKRQGGLLSGPQGSTTKVKLQPGGEGSRQQTSVSSCVTLQVVFWSLRCETCM